MITLDNNDLQFVSGGGEAVRNHGDAARFVYLSRNGDPSGERFVYLCRNGDPSGERFVYLG